MSSDSIIWNILVQSKLIESFVWFWVTIFIKISIFVQYFYRISIRNHSYKGEIHICCLCYLVAMEKASPQAIRKQFVRMQIEKFYCAVVEHWRLYLFWPFFTLYFHFIVLFSIPMRARMHFRIFFALLSPDVTWNKKMWHGRHTGSI